MAADLNPPASSPPQLSYTEQLAHITVRIEVVFKDGQTGSGTGFFFKLKDTESSYIPVVVTNRHVVQNTAQGYFTLTLKRDDGAPEIGKHKRIRIDEFETHWKMHPDKNVDLAIMPIAPLLRAAANDGIEFFYKSFRAADVAMSSYREELTAVEPVLMVGYPVGLWDEKNNFPIFRSGITATHPARDYNGRSEFMIDVACFPGSSGSPVILYNMGNYVDKSGNTIIGGNRVKFLGVLWGGPQFTATGEVKVVEVPTRTIPVAETQIPSNLGYVIRAERILEFEQYFE